MSNARRARRSRKSFRIFGRSKALKGESQERPAQKWVEGAKGSKASREFRTLKAQRAGTWKSRVKRTLFIGDRCREQNPRRGVVLVSRAHPGVCSQRDGGSSVIPWRRVKS
jgi:hypothetical protein